MNVDSWNYLSLQGLLSSTPTYPEYTRVNPRVGPLSRYVEFRTASAVGLPTQAQATAFPHQLVDVHVPMSSFLFFSDYPTLIPDPKQILDPTIAHVLNHNQPTFSGLVLSDGSPVTANRVKDAGPVHGLTATSKEKSLYELSLTVENGELQGRVGKTNWVSSRAVLSIDKVQAVTLGLGYSPTDLLLSFSCTHGNIGSWIDVDVSGVVGGAGSARLTRVVSYYGEPISSQVEEMPTGDARPPMYLATSPLYAFADEIDMFSPALSVVVGPLENQGKPALPLQVLGALDVGPGEKEADYVNRGTTLAGPSLAVLLAQLSPTFIPGFADLAQWLAWSLSSFGIENTRDAFTSAYAARQAWIRAQSAPSPNTTKPAATKSIPDH